MLGWNMWRGYENAEGSFCKMAKYFLKQCSHHCTNSLLLPPVSLFSTGGENYKKTKTAREQLQSLKWLLLYHAAPLHS